MKGKPRLHLSIRLRLMLLFMALLIAFTVIQNLLYTAMMRSQMIAHYTQTMQRDAYAISQNLSELIAPSSYDGLDDTRFIVREDTLAPYMALIEQMTNCNVYLVDAQHNVTGYFDGLVQTLQSPLLPAYIEQTIALGFMGKTPTIQAWDGSETHLTACMPVMNAQSRVLGVVLLESTLREQGYTQVQSTAALTASVAISLLLSVVLAFVFSRQFTRPISRLQKTALALSGGQYEARTQVSSWDEIGSLARSMDILAERLEAARQRDERLRSQQQVFFSNISHELKTPVTVIRGSLEALRDGVIADGQGIQEAYAQMIAESRWLQRLIQDLLELSRLQSVDFSLTTAELDLRELLGDVAMSAHTLCERKGIVFCCDEPERAYPFRGDYTRLRQMLLAVVDNAVKFTPPGRRIRMALRGEQPELIIADEGIGIPPQELGHIFDRFYHTRSSSQDSTGLGLAIVQEIARRHGIAIRVDSREGEGTTFTFLFPKG